MERNFFWKNEKKDDDLQNISRIANLSEFGVYSSESKVLITKNLKYGVFWNENMVAIVDLDKKDIVSKYMNDMNQTTSRIKKLKLTETNNCVYLRQSSNKYDLVISSIDFLGEHFELSFVDEILEFHYAESAKHTSEYIFLLNNKGELLFIQNFFDLNQMIKVNVVNDCNLDLNILKSKCEMIFIEETDSLILFFSNGIIINYSISQNPEMMKEDKGIYFEEFIYINKFDNNLNLGSNIFNLVKFHIIRIDEKEESQEMNIDEEMVSKLGTFLILNYTMYNSDTVVILFKIQSNKLISHNKYVDNFKHKVLIDSYVFESIEDSYLIVALKEEDKIEFHRAIVLEMTNQTEDNNSINPFIKITEYKEQRTLVCMKILGAYVNYNQNFSVLEDIEEDRSFMNLGQKETDYFRINVYVRRLLNINDNHYICDCEIESNSLSNNQPSNSMIYNRNNASEEINDEFYFEYCFNVEKINNSLLQVYFEKIKVNLHTFLGREFLNIEKKEIDFFVLSLIYNNKIFMLRNYLFLKKENNEYLVSNEKMTKTVNPFILNIEKVIIETIDKNLNEPFLKDDNLKSYLEILVYIFKVIKSRLIVPLKKPFELEASMLQEESKELDSNIEKAEKLLLALKIIRSFLNNIYLQKENLAVEIWISNLFIQRKGFLKYQSALLSNNSSCILEVILGNSEGYPNIKLILKNIISNDNFSKFQLFFYYFYYIFDLLLAKNTDNYKNLNFSKNYNTSEQINSKSISINLQKTIHLILNDSGFKSNLKNIFEELYDEYEKYKDISETLYALDLNLLLQENGASLFNIDTQQLSKFFDLISSEKLIKPIHNTSHTIFNLIINFLCIMNYKKEALLISRKLIKLSPELEDLRTQLKILLDSNLNQHAFIFLDSCFASYLYSPENFKEEKDIMKKLKSMPEYKDYRSLAFTFFEHLLTNDNLDFLISLPFNTFESQLFMDFLDSKSEYVEIRLIYLIKKNKVLSAKQLFGREIKTNNNISIEQKDLYERLIINLELVQNNSVSYQKGLQSSLTHLNFKISDFDKTINKSVDTLVIKEERMDIQEKNGNHSFYN